MGAYEAVVKTMDDGSVGASGPVTVQLRNARTGQRQQFSMDAFTGGHLLHLAVAGCVYNDLFREALARGIVLTHVEVRADGGFTGNPCSSTGISYTIHLAGDAPQTDLEDLVAHVERIAEVPSAIRMGGEVHLTSQTVLTDPHQTA